MRLRLQMGWVLIGWVLVAWPLWAAAASPAVGVRPKWTAATAAMPTAAARALAQRVVGAADHGQRPFAIVDKQAAVLVMFHADGTLAGSTSVLLGRDRGDRSAPGVGERTQNGRLLAGDATTPAGRFVSYRGINHSGETVVWVDPAAAFAIHRLRPGPGAQERARRLSSAIRRDKRVSAGCVVVPVAFYEQVVEPLLGRRSVVYVMPEDGRWQALWGDIAEGGM